MKTLLPVALGLLLPAVACGGNDGSSGERAGTGDTVSVAVASNFARTHQRLARRFTEETGVPVRTSTGSSGRLFAQIANGAPYDLFLSADAERPRRLEEEGRAVPGTRFTYAVGRLALYGPGLDSVRSGGGDLRDGAFERLAIANPRLAPYGSAARRVLDRLGLREAVAGRTLLAENVGQALQYVASGGAELGFVALAHVRDRPSSAYWTVPDTLHDPIRQDAVLLRRAASHSGARAYREFLAGEAAAEIIRDAGYSVPAPPRSSRSGGGP